MQNEIVCALSSSWALSVNLLELRLCGLHLDRKTNSRCKLLHVFRKLTELSLCAESYETTVLTSIKCSLLCQSSSLNYSLKQCQRIQDICPTQKASSQPLRIRC